MEWTTCNLCGSNQAALYYEGRDRQLGGTEQFRLVRCRQCGLIYLNPRPSRDEIGRYYPDDYEPFTRFSHSRGGPLARWSYTRYLDKRCKAVMRWKSSGRLLDLGCATGEFLARMMEYGWQVQGVELSPTAAETARREYGLDILTGDLAQAQFPDRHFDVVTLWDVLEHLYDPLAELAEINRTLKDDGLLVIELPNTRSFDAALFGPYWIGLDMPRHLYVFPPAPLEALLTQSGFEIISRRCYSGGYGAFVLSLNFWIEERPFKWLSRLVTGLSKESTLRLLLSPYIYLSYALGKGPEVTFFCQKITG